MPRFITVHVQCDWSGCDAIGVEGEETVAPMTLSLNGSAPKEFLICKSHRDDIDRIIVPLLQAGVKVEKAKRSRTKPQASSPSSSGNGSDETPGEIRCLHQGCGRDDIKNKAGLVQHIMRSHGYENLAEYEALHGVQIT